ncbi:MAG TPA: DUF4349 domain-containing protein [Candidatus Limnocylindrales bacterium]|nr:DUF4349 domain-containing protein [Candidatus Limnocylindrales bacterium]
MMSSNRGMAGRRLVPVVLTALALIVVACGAAGSAASTPANGGLGNGGLPAYGGSDAENPGGLPAASLAPAAPGGATQPPKAQGGDEAAFRDGAKIIRNGSMQLEVADVPKALASARSSILGVGGYIGASQQYRDGDNDVATVEYRIPVERWEDALDALRGLGTEVGEQTDSADVTSQIVDLDARIRNLRASESALVAYLEKSTQLNDMLEIESRLTNVRSQIEQLVAQKESLDDRVAYATLAVTFGVEVAPIKVAAENWDPGAEVGNAGATLLGFLQALATVGIWFGIVWLPVLLVVGVIAGVVYAIGRRLGWFRRPAGPPIPPLPPTPAAG